MKKLTQAVAVASLMASGAAYADLGASFDLETGRSISAELKYSHDSGAYGGLAFKDDGKSGQPFVGYKFKGDGFSAGAKFSFPIINGTGGTTTYLSTGKKDKSGLLAGTFSERKAEIKVHASFAGAGVYYKKPLILMTNTKKEQPKNSEAGVSYGMDAFTGTLKFKMDGDSKVDKSKGLFKLEYAYNDQLTFASEIAIWSENDKAEIEQPTFSASYSVPLD